MESMKYVSPTYLGAMSSLFSPTQTTRKRYKNHDEHTPRNLLKNKKKKRKTVSNSRKKNRK
jgi:hypothetical protein